MELLKLLILQSYIVSRYFSFFYLCVCVLIAFKGHSFYNLFIFTRTQGLANLSSKLNK